MNPMFNEYKDAGKIQEALLIGRNMVNKAPGDSECVNAYLDFLLMLAEKLPRTDERKSFADQANLVLSFYEENNKKAVNAYNSAFTSFKNNESRYKDKSQLFSLVSTTLFTYDAGRLFNETLIFYNHVYSYIFNKLDDNGKLELTKYSIECERKQG